MEEREGRPPNGGGPIEEPGWRGAGLNERFEELNSEIGRIVRDRPGTALLVAVGVGFLVGRILRA